MFFKFIANAILSEKKNWAENKWATKTAQAVLQRVPRLVRHATKGRRQASSSQNGKTECIGSYLKGNLKELLETATCSTETVSRFHSDTIYRKNRQL